ncbi:YeeE/YedE family protein [Pseudaminobacter arsenicus]|uniref:YeeE/YedE family protein n=1 Tax=Borborobacter arsenicus TaxID=1851146 RepID=A0A432V1Q1_9HYPH|nr:YeeE/YedE family protein [Pseudaminobacter arsenicus]RUM96109.1 YeeE/YedE family protein [Pseudaminobacter arsenicus]
MTEFTPVASLIGGALIGLSAVLLMALEGRIAGISGIAARLLPPYHKGGVLSRLGFVLGLVLAPLLDALVSGAPVVQTVSSNLPLMLIAGLLVGFGSVYGSGCTSGHGVCGLARLSPRSLVATLVFMAVAIATVFVVRHLA